MIDVVPDVGVNPDYGLARTGQFRVRRSSFGDGYERRRPDGINTHIREWTLTWTGLSREQADVLSEFFDSRIGVYAFLWYEPTSGLAHQVTSPEPCRVVASDYGSFQVSVTVREDFSP